MYLCVWNNMKRHYGNIATIKQWFLLFFFWWSLCCLAFAFSLSLTIGYDMVDVFVKENEPFLLWSLPPQPPRHRQHQHTTIPPPPVVNLLCKRTSTKYISSSYKRQQPHFKGKKDECFVYHRFWSLLKLFILFWLVHIASTTIVFISASCLTKFNLTRVGWPGVSLYYLSSCFSYFSYFCKMIYNLNVVYMHTHTSSHEYFLTITKRISFNTLDFYIAKLFYSFDKENNWNLSKIGHLRFTFLFGYLSKIENMCVH